MNAIDASKSPLTISGFNGLYQRGLSETCPQDHLQQCNNCIFPGKSQVGIREPVTAFANIATRTIISFQYVTPSNTIVLLTLDASGNLRDETNSNLLGNFTGADDFVTLSIFNRVYICLKVAGKAMPSTSVYYYYNGPLGWTFTTAGGNAPTAAPTLAQVNPGVVDAGVHGVAYSFQTETGYITPPSPVAHITSTGSNDIELSGIQTGSAFVVARVIFMTLANETELFFVPLGTIPDNTTTTFTINNHDSALITSADYLNDILTTLPACSSLRFYNGRIAYIGQTLTPDNLLMSNQDDPETVNQVTGVVNLPEDYITNGTNTAAVIRDVLYTMKPNGTYAVQDNGGDPGTWSVTAIDTGLGTYDTGLSIFRSTGSGQDILDQCFVLHTRGLLLFNGSFSDPPLSYKVDGIWNTVDLSNFHKVQLAHDVNLKRIYIILPVILQPGNVSAVKFLMGDYQEGLGFTTIKWSTWDITGITSNSNIYKILINNFYVYNLAFCTGGTFIYRFLPPASNYIAPTYGDLTTLPINQFIQTTDLSYGPGINIFSVLTLNTIGVGQLNIQLLYKKSLTPVTITGFDLTAYNPNFGTGSFVAAAGTTLYRGINFLNESCSIFLQCNSVFTQAGFSSQLVAMFQLSSIELYGKVMYKLRPDYVQNV